MYSSGWCYLVSGLWICRYLRDSLKVGSKPIRYKLWKSYLDLWLRSSTLLLILFPEEVLEGDNKLFCVIMGSILKVWWDSQGVSAFFKCLIMQQTIFTSLLRLFCFSLCFKALYVKHLVQFPFISILFFSSCSNLSLRIKDFSQLYEISQYHIHKPPYICYSRWPTCSFSHCCIVMILWYLMLTF